MNELCCPFLIPEYFVLWRRSLGVGGLHDIPILLVTTLSPAAMDCKFQGGTHCRGQDKIKNAKLIFDEEQVVCMQQLCLPRA